jgi:hypothetical protein
MVAAHGGFTFNKKDEQNKVITANPLTHQLFVVPVVLKGFVERIIKIRPFIFFLQPFKQRDFIHLSNIRIPVFSFDDSSLDFVSTIFIKLNSILPKSEID